MGLLGKLAEIVGAGGARPEQLPGRNEACWCGSGRKYKRCHLESDQRRDRGKRATCTTA